MAAAHLLVPNPSRVSESQTEDDLNVSKNVFPGSQEPTVDQIIENEARRCWDSLVDNGKIASLFQDSSKETEYWFDPRLKAHSFKSNAGLFHAIIKHGSSFDFLKNPEENFWLEKLNRSCEEFKKFRTSTLKDSVRKLIRENFDQILMLSKQLGEYVKELIENPNRPVLMVSNEKAILVFSKIRDSRFYMFVLADGAGPLPKFTLVTAMRLRFNNFKKRILVNGKIPKLWFDYYTGRIHYCSPEIFSDNGLFIHLGRKNDNYNYQKSKASGNNPTIKISEFGLPKSLEVKKDDLLEPEQAMDEESIRSGLVHEVRDRSKASLDCQAAPVKWQSIDEHSDSPSDETAKERGGQHERGASGRYPQGTPIRLIVCFSATR